MQTIFSPWKSSTLSVRMWVCVRVCVCVCVYVCMCVCVCVCTKHPIPPPSYVKYAALPTTHSNWIHREAPADVWIEGWGGGVEKGQKPRDNISKFPWDHLLHPVLCGEIFSSQNESTGDPSQDIYVHIFMYMNVYVYVYVFTYACKYTHTHTYVYIQTHTHTNTCTYICRCVYVAGVAKLHTLRCSEHAARAALQRARPRRTLLYLPLCHSVFRVYPHENLELANACLDHQSADTRPWKGASPATLL